MTDIPQPSRADSPPLTGLQATRLDFARRDLEYARAEDLGQLEPASLILIIERLRGRLDDMIDLVSEVHDSPGEPRSSP